jgi:hypothetical protein
VDVEMNVNVNLNATFVVDVFRTERTIRMDVSDSR